VVERDFAETKSKAKRDFNINRLKIHVKCRFLYSTKAVLALIYSSTIVVEQTLLSGTLGSSVVVFLLSIDVFRGICHQPLEVRQQKPAGPRPFQGGLTCRFPLFVRLLLRRIANRQSPNRPFAATQVVDPIVRVVLFVLDGMGNGNRFVGLLCRRLGKALQKGLERPVEISGIFLEKGKAGIFFQKQVVNNGRRDKRRGLGAVAAAAAVAAGQYPRRRRQNPGRPKADPDLARRSHGMEFVRELHSRPAPLGGGFLEDFEQDTGVS